MAYVVQTHTLCDGWVNCWTLEDEQGSIPVVFDTVGAARADLTDHFDREREMLEYGEIESVSDPSDYRIVNLETGEVITE